MRKLTQQQKDLKECGVLISKIRNQVLSLQEKQQGLETDNEVLRDIIDSKKLIDSYGVQKYVKKEHNDFLQK